MNAILNLDAILNESETKIEQRRVRTIRDLRLCHLLEELIKHQNKEIILIQNKKTRKYENLNLNIENLDFNDILTLEQEKKAKISYSITNLDMNNNSYDRIIKVSL